MFEQYESYYFRSQESKFNGTIPVNHKSFERTAYTIDDAKYVEKGVSCCSTPEELMEYLSNELNDMDTTDVVVFSGHHLGYGIDDEDVVEFDEKSEIIKVMSLRNFFKKMLKDEEIADEYTKEWIQEVYSK